MTQKIYSPIIFIKNILMGFADTNYVALEGVKENITTIKNSKCKQVPVIPWIKI